MKAGQRLHDKEYVLYCPECDGLHVLKDLGAYIFEDELGLFVSVFCRNSGPGLASFTITFHNFYIIGEL